MRRGLKAVGLGTLIGIGGMLFGLSPVGAVFETGLGLSWLFNLRGVVNPPQEVAVVAINSRTGAMLDLPESPQEWPRSIHGQLVDNLVQRGASVIVFDVFFGAGKDPDQDQLFVDAVNRANRVVLVEKLTGKRQPITDRDGVHVGSVWVEELVSPMEHLAKAAKGLAPFPLPKLDAAVYEFWTFKSSVGDAPTMPAIALQLHATGALQSWQALLAGWQLPVSEPPVLPEKLGKSAEVRNLMRQWRGALVNQNEASLIWPELATADGQLLRALAALYSGEPHRFINFYGPPGTIPTIPYHAVIKGSDPNLPPEALDFTNKVVFVGFSDLYDPGQPDRFYTVFTGEDGVDLSGVEIAATSFANLLTDDALKPVGTAETALLLALFGFFLGLMIYLLPAIVGVPLALVLAGLYVFWAQWQFNAAAVWWPLATPMLVQFPVALFAGLLAQYLLERRRSIQVTEAINYYLPENVARELTENRLDPAQANKVVYSTCLATDMAGFSTIAEQMPPDKLASFLNEYFEALAQPLKNHQVDVTEFRADAIMCAWTAGGPSVSIRSKAIFAALEAVEAIEHFKVRHQMLGAKLRIGLECGNVYVGHAGGGGHFVYSIVGDCANTASRIEGLNKHLGTQLAATAAVTEGLDDLLLLRPMGKFQFVGKTEGLPIVEILASRSDATPDQLDLCSRFAAALQCFQQGDWVSAETHFQELLSHFPDDGPSLFFRARCQKYLAGAEPPEDLTTVRMDAK
ncbi:MAG: adenylate/guanylate cyclase domain-containing protein [Gammaproteobacteria bacterium]|nr:MAG: adenylate/guanylate cyclase domain-containing protein [Gammaproteobacteria bacterium]